MPDSVSVILGPQSNGDHIVGLRTMEDWEDFTTHIRKITGKPYLVCRAPDEDAFPCLINMQGITHDGYLDVLNTHHIANMVTPAGYHFTDDPIAPPQRD